MNAAASEARRFVRRCDSGALSTLSQRHPGYPFGSLTPFSLDDSASPVILVSALAEHSRNLEADPRSSLMVRESSADEQAAARVTLVTRAEPLGDEPRMVDRYLRYHPSAAKLLELGDFRFLRLRPVAVRYIGGFGAIRWIDAADYAPPAFDLNLQEFEVKQAPRLLRLCIEKLGHEPRAVRLLGVDCDGVDLRADETRLRMDFPVPALDSTQVAASIASLAQAS